MSSTGKHVSRGATSGQPSLPERTVADRASEPMHMERIAGFSALSQKTNQLAFEDSSCGEMPELRRRG